MEQHIVLVAAFAVVLSLIQGGASFPTDLKQETDKLWPIPQMNGSVHWMTETEALAQATSGDFNETFDTVKFFLYTEANPTKPIEIIKDDPESLARSNFNPKNPTRFMIHGWMSGYAAGWSIREALLMNGTNRQYNFISVDWTVYARSKFYISSQRKCSKVGKIVAEFIDWLHDEAKLPFDTLAIYGSSLGAHVAGFAGKNVKRGKVQTIVGFDPAMPLFRYDQREKRLCSSDAVYVETIQTNGGLLGFYKPIGKAAFYPNGGKSQPGCEGYFFCSHGRSLELFAEALLRDKNNTFFAVECSDLESMQNANCGRRITGVRLGDPDNVNKAKGIYYLPTNSHSPYAIINL